MSLSSQVTALAARVATECKSIRTALAGKEPTITAATSTPTGMYWRGDKIWALLNKAAVGLDLVDNTSDANKPVSTAQQTALNLKAPLASPTFTGTVSGVTKAMVGLGNADNTSDLLKPISTATQGALDAKEPTVAASTASQFYRGDKTWRAVNGYNLLVNPGFEDVQSNGNNAVDPHVAVTGITLGPSSISRSGVGAAHLRCTAAVIAGDVFIANGVATQVAQPNVMVGETYRAEFWVRNGVSGTTTPSVRAYIKTRDSTGALVESASSAAVTVTATYTLLTVDLTVTNPAGQFIICGINAPNGLAVGDAFRIDDMTLRFIPVIPSVISTPVFTYQGSVGLVTGTQRYYAMVNSTLVLSRASLGTAGSTATTVVIKKNATTAVTMTIPASSNTIPSSTSVALVAGDYLTVDVTAAGTGAADLTVQTRIAE